MANKRWTLPRKSRLSSPFFHRLVERFTVVFPRVIGVTTRVTSASVSRLPFLARLDKGIAISHDVWMLHGP